MSFFLLRAVLSVAWPGATAAQKRWVQGRSHIPVAESHSAGRGPRRASTGGSCLLAAKTCSSADDRKCCHRQSYVGFPVVIVLECLVCREACIALVSKPSNT